MPKNVKDSILQAISASRSRSPISRSESEEPTESVPGGSQLESKSTKPEGPISLRSYGSNELQRAEIRQLVESTNNTLINWFYPTIENGRVKLRSFRPSDWEAKFYRENDNVGFENRRMVIIKTPPITDDHSMLRIKFANRMRNQMPLGQGMVPNQGGNVG